MATGKCWPDARPRLIKRRLSQLIHRRFVRLHLSAPNSKSPRRTLSHVSLNFDFTRIHISALQFAFKRFVSVSQPCVCGTYRGASTTIWHKTWPRPARHRAQPQRPHQSTRLTLQPCHTREERKLLSNVLTPDHDSNKRHLHSDESCSAIFSI